MVFVNGLIPCHLHSDWRPEVPPLRLETKVTSTPVGEHNRVADFWLVSSFLCMKKAGGFRYQCRRTLKMECGKFYLRVLSLYVRIGQGSWEGLHMRRVL